MLSMNIEHVRTTLSLELNYYRARSAFNILLWNLCRSAIYYNLCKYCEHLNLRQKYMNGLCLSIEYGLVPFILSDVLPFCHLFKRSLNTLTRLRAYQKSDKWCFAYNYLSNPNTRCNVVVLRALSKRRNQFM